VQPPPILVYSHLRWASVFQRPQQLMSRLARERDVVFVEEPLSTNGRPAWELESPVPRLVVARAHVPAANAIAFGGPHVVGLSGMLRRLLRRLRIGPHVAWLYTPMALPLARTLGPELIAYDCMDELAAFDGAPPELPGLEAELLRAADVVFTGGPSLYRAKRERHPFVHCFPSSVDAAHFARARAPLPEAPPQRGLPRPRLGFYGVLDERLDRDLLDAVACARPDWQLVVAGPVAKIAPESLPRRPNVHYPGPVAYADLPAYLAGWDVCLLPFARNAATRFISPTKTLEYMAAEKPIVTTPIRDVVEPYADVVYAGEGPAAFVAACERALGASAAEREARAARMREIVAGTSWDRTAAAMARELVRAGMDTRDVAVATGPGRRLAGGARP
jgi:UDP-galactopyranose mutase